jgi:molecular chaperone GrpE
MAVNEEQRVDEQNISDDGPGQNRDEELRACTQEVADLKETCKHIAADFENFKRRVERDRVAWTQSAQASVLRDLLPVVDDFDRAISEYQKSGQEVEHATWIAGFDLIRKALNKFLQSYGVTEIQQTTSFDPELHEAVAHVESQTHESGTIVDVMQKGYMFNGRILRVARVTVAK